MEKLGKGTTSNDLDAWADTARDLGLGTVSLPSPDGKIVELAIFNPSDLGRGFLWIKEHRLIGQDGEIKGDLTSAEALALLARLSRR